MSSHMKEMPFSFKAKTAVVKHRFIKNHADRQNVEQAGANEGFAVAMNDADAGGFVEGAMLGGGAKVEAGGTIAKGALVRSDATGKAVTAAIGETALGRAMEAAVSGDKFSIERVEYNLHA